MSDTVERNGAQGLADVQLDGSITLGDRSIVLHEFPGPQIETLWRDFLTHAKYPAHYDTPEYFLEPLWNNLRPFAILALHDETVIGVMTGIHVGDSVRCGLMSRPQVCIERSDLGSIATRILAEGLLKEAGPAKLITVFSWSWTPLTDFERYGFRKFEQEGNVVLDLSVGKDKLFKGSHENRKRNIRAAIKSGIEVSEATTEDDLAAFWVVHSAWQQTERKKIRGSLTLAQAEACHKLRQNRRQFLARYQGNVIAATTVRFCPNGIIEYSENCSLDRFMNLRPNDLLIWRTIEWACDQGFVKYSLGGAHPFLRKAGGTVVPIQRYRLDRSFLNRHDRQEEVETFLRKLSRRLPQPLQSTLRRILRH